MNSRTASDEQTSNIRINKGVVFQEGPLRDVLVHLFSFIRTPQQADGFVLAQRIAVDGIVVIDPQHLVHAGSSIELYTHRDLEPKVNTDIRIIYEDEYLLAINKPAPLPVHPAGRYYFNTVEMRLKEMVRQGMISGELHTVHRLDRETSGVLLFAKSKEVRIKLGRMFMHGELEKTYLGLVFGCPEPKTGSITTGFRILDHGKIRHHILAVPEAPFFTTTYEVLATNSQFSLLLINPKEGQKHQIRVHLASIGHALLGDKQYAFPELFDRIIRTGLTAEDESLLLFSRHALHAWRLRLSHPITGEVLELQADPPEDLVSFATTAFSTNVLKLITNK